MAGGDSSLGTTMSSEIPDAVLNLVMNYVEEPLDRNAISLVCRDWNVADASSRKHVTISMAYSTTPDRLFRRFPYLESLKVKATIFDLKPEDRGGFASPWIRKLSASFSSLKMLHLRRMVVSDDDLTIFVDAKANMLVSLKLECCSGFSTQSLALIARSCMKLEMISVEDSIIADETNDGWLLELATKNTVLETLNFFSTDLSASFTYLALLVSNCRRLNTLMISGCLMSDLSNLFCSTVTLQEFAGDCWPGEDEGGEITVRYMLLKNVGVSDNGLLALARGCPSLQKLELRSCCFSERAIADAVLQLKSLRYLRVKGYSASPTGSDLMAMARPFWNIEFIPPSQGEPSAEGQAQILAYYSLAGARTDLPHLVIPLHLSV